MTTAAGIQSYECTTLTFADDQQLACLYVIVDGRADRHVADFLARWHGCCDASRVDWQTVRRPRSALVGIELAHTCGIAELEELRLRLVFDVSRDADALARLAATEALVVGTRAYGSFANVMGAYGVDGHAVRRAVASAEVGLRELVGAST